MTPRREGATLLRKIADPARRARALWAVPCWFIVFMTLGLGLPYAVGGRGVVPLPAAYEAVQRVIPGGMHVYGAVMAAFGVVLADALIQPLHRQPIRDRQIKLALPVFTVFALSAVSGFAASWALTGVRSWQFIVFWSGLALLAVGTLLFAPDPAPKAGGSSRSGAGRVA